MKEAPENKNFLSGVTRNLVKSLSLVLILSGTNAVASPNMTIDLAKFSAEAKSKISAALGADSIEEDSVRIVFQDGAGGLGIDPVTDLASLNYIAKAKSTILPNSNLLVSYRLRLGGGATELMLVNIDSQMLVFYTSNSGTAMLKENFTPKQIVVLEQQLRAVAPEINLTILSEIGVLTYNCSPKNGVKVATVLKSVNFLDSVEIDSEWYNAPFEFRPFQAVGTSGKIDLDTLRTLTKEIQDEGTTLVPKASVPAHLQ